MELRNLHQSRSTEITSIVSTLVNSPVKGTTRVFRRWHAPLPSDDTNTWEYQNKLHLLRLAAALRACPPGSYACGHSAALIWGLPVPKRYMEEIHVRVPDTASHRPMKIRPTQHTGVGRVLRFVRRTGNNEIVNVGGIPTLDFIDTLIDASKALPVRWAFAALCAGFRKIVKISRYQPTNHLTALKNFRDTLLEKLAEHGAVPNRYKARHRIKLFDPMVESPGESHVACELRVLGITNAIYQKQWDPSPLPGAPQKRYFTDIYLPDDDIIIEYDGAAKLTPQSLREEKQREDTLRGIVKRVIRYTSRHLTQPALLRALLLPFLGTATLANLKPRADII